MSVPKFNCYHRVLLTSSSNYGFKGGIDIDDLRHVAASDVIILSTAGDSKSEIFPLCSAPLGWRVSMGIPVNSSLVS